VPGLKDIPWKGNRQTDNQNRSNIVLEKVILVEVLYSESQFLSKSF